VGPDLVKAFGDFVAGQLLLRHQPMHDRREVEGLVGRPLLKRPRAEQAQAIVDVVHLRQALLFVVNSNLAPGEHHVARVIPAFVPVDRHQACLPALLESFRDRTQIDREIGVPVKDEEFFAEEGKGSLERAAGAEQDRTVEGIFEPHSVRRAVAELALDHFPEMAEAEDGALNALSSKQRQLVGQEGAAGHGNQNLGHALGDRPQARGQAAGEDGDGQG